MRYCYCLVTKHLYTHSTRERGMVNGQEYGRAVWAMYGKKGTGEALQAELPHTRAVTKAPSGLEISVAEGVESLKDPVWASLVDKIQRQPIPPYASLYVVKARQAGASAQKVARDVAGIANQAYQTMKDELQVVGAKAYTGIAHPAGQGVAYQR